MRNSELGGVDYTKRAHDSQDGEGGIVLISNQSQVRVHTIDSSVGDVDAVQESKDEQQTEDGNNADVDLPDQYRLVDVWVYILGSDLSIDELCEVPISGGTQGVRSW